MNDTEENLGVLLTWINIFNLPRWVTSTCDLADGIILHTVLNFLAPEYFLEPWHLSSRTQIERFDDLKIGLNKFCTSGLPDHLDLTKDLKTRDLVGGGTSEDWVTLLQLVLLTSIKSIKKNICIQRMMQQLGRSDQQQLMKIINNSLFKFGFSTQPETPAQNPNKIARLNQARKHGPGSRRAVTTTENKRLQKLHEIQSKVDELNIEITSAASKCELLEKKRADEIRKINNLRCQVLTQKKKHALQLSEKEQVIKKHMNAKRQQELQLAEKAQDVKKYKVKTKFLQEEARDWEQHVQELKKINEELMVWKTQDRNAGSKLSKVKLELRRKVKILEANENQSKLMLEGFRREVENLKNYKEIYDRQLQRSAELEQELLELPALKQQLEECNQFVLKSAEEDKKVEELTQNLTEIKAEKHSMKEKLDKTRTDMQHFEDVLKEIQKTETIAKGKIYTLVAELGQTVSLSDHNKILNELEGSKTQVEQLSDKLTVQCNLEINHRKKIEELEKKNIEMTNLLTSLKRKSQSISPENKEKENTAMINQLEQEHKNKMKKLKEKLIQEKLVHSREQRLIFSAVNSFGDGLLEIS